MMAIRRSKFLYFSIVSHNSSESLIYTRVNVYRHRKLAEFFKPKLDAEEKKIGNFENKFEKFPIY